MRTQNFLLLLSPLWLAASVAHGAEASYFKISDLRQSPTAKEQAARSVKLFWGDEATPAFAEMAPPDVYTRSSISLSPFGGSQRHCVDGFELALTALVDDAVARGYDAIVNIRPAVDGKPSADAMGFSCKPGYKTTEVPLYGTFAMTQAAQDRMAADEKSSAAPGPRPPAKGAIFMALEPILTSPEAKAVLGTSMEAHAGLEAPAYVLRYGPDNYEGEAELKALGPEGACKQAAVNALAAMVDVAKEKGMDTVIKVRSFIDEQYTPVVTDLECVIGKKVASVSLRASVAKRK